MESLTPQQALREAANIAGTQTALASICGVTQTAVWKWLSQDKVLPGEHVLKVEAATGISRHVLRPDLYPDESEAAAPAARNPAACP